MDQRWPYSDRYLPAAPVVKVDLLGLSLECVLDSGFDGGIVIPFSTFPSLGLLNDIWSDEYYAVIPDSRSLPLFTSRKMVRPGSHELEVMIHARLRLAEPWREGISWRVS